jgi:hypothetical protein
MVKVPEIELPVIVPANAANWFEFGIANDALTCPPLTLPDLTVNTNVSGGVGGYGQSGAASCSNVDTWPFKTLPVARFTSREITVPVKERL